MTDHPPSHPSASPLLPSFPISHTNLLIAAISTGLFLGLFYYLAQLDVPTLQIVRTFTHPAVDHIGNVGNRLGDGLTLVLISLGIGAVGFRLGWPNWKAACIHTLLAHGLAGLFAQLLKHTIGRPRPRLMQGQDWIMAPSLESGWDSFPSGHTTASFAVATVLGHYFPNGRIVWFGLAVFIGTCRVITGAHYPTDVLGGVLVGIGTALIIIHPPQKWKEVARQTLTLGLPWLVTAFGLTWILVPHPGIELEPNISLFFGLLMLMVGLGLRLWWIREHTKPNSPSELSVPTWPRLLMGLGLATSTGSLIIVGFSLLAGTIWWMGNQSELTTEVKNNFLAGFNPIWMEAILGLVMFFLTILIFTIRSG
ncbi:MAG TPA: phosphatase PAP2 family protein [Nitrospirales bacterium]|nr:phosphatase PAP2 family protein [Nitrospirales bacterium]